MILDPKDLKKFVDDWLKKGHHVDIDLESGKLKIQPAAAAEPTSLTDFDLVNMRRKK